MVNSKRKQCSLQPIFRRDLVCRKKTGRHKSCLPCLNDVKLSSVPSYLNSQSITNILKVDRKKHLLFRRKRIGIKAYVDLVKVLRKCMKLAWSLKYGVCYSIYSVVVKYSKVTVMVGQNRYSKLRIPSQLHTLVFRFLFARCGSHYQNKRGVRVAPDFGSQGPGVRIPQEAEFSS